MELQLGLALPCSNPTSKAFDLNYYGFEANNKEVDHVIGPCYTPSYEDINDIINIDNNNNNNKRSFGQAFESSTRDRVVPRTLPLLLWNNNHPNEEDDPKDLENHSLFAANKNVWDGDGVVGWPPIKSWRKRLCHENQVDRAWNNNQMVENGYVCGGRRASNSMYVKVKMEGVVIARKVDLSQHHSFETLTDTLMDMFRKWSEACEKNSNNYKLIYQDREGDWLFAQDVPWRTFIRSVQRLKLLKSSG